jgi:hypothetical protein
MNNKELNFVLDYLINEGYTDCHESASKILDVMSDEWLESILNEVSDDYMRRSAAAGDAALQAKKERERKAQREKSRNAPVYRDDQGRRVVPGTSKGKKGYFHGREFVDSSKVTGG